MACTLAAGLLTGIIAAAIASSKGRSVVGWFFGGFFLGLIGVIVVAVLPNLTEQKARWEYSEQERRRLREQLRQERMKNEAFRQYTSERLDTHDSALSMDTRTRNALPEDTAAALHQLGSDRSGLSPSRALGMNPLAPVWFYENGGQSKGPVSAMDIRQLLDVGTITSDTLVWSQDLGDWTPLRAVPALQPRNTA